MANSDPRLLLQHENDAVLVGQEIAALVLALAEGRRIADCNG